MTGDWGGKLNKKSINKKTLETNDNKQKENQQIRLMRNLLTQWELKKKTDPKLKLLS